MQQAATDSIEFTRTVESNVNQALAEDIGTGDITASLIPGNQRSTATLLCRESAVIAGRPWFDEVYRQLDANVSIQWHVREGQSVAANQTLLTAEGPARTLLTGERAALNFLQTLSAVATHCSHYASIVEGTGVKLLDTRKTLPGLRIAQKYAVVQGGCHNHRMGLYDAYLIKENHIIACGGICEAINLARQNHPDKPVEVEVESLEEFLRARDAKADIVMLDNFSLEQMTQAVAANKRLPGHKPVLEASGGVTEKQLRAIAATGIDCISIGALTKNCSAIDLSMRLTETTSAIGPHDSPSQQEFD